MSVEKTYLCLDLKSFYASVECIERGLDPLTTNLVVADDSRTDKTICLAVTPSLKSMGVKGRPRLFEVKQRLKELNRERRSHLKHNFMHTSYDIEELQQHPYTKIGAIIAPPRMAHYIQYSTRVFEVYLKYVSKEDMFVYSVDEVFLDITGYLNVYNCTAYELAVKIIQDVLKTTKIVATGGIGTNPYLAKVAMDIVAKQLPKDEFGVRIAMLDETSYKEVLWDHTPLTDFWRVGRGYAKKLAANNLYTMGDIARCSLENEDLLYGLFGINAELLIDHAWGIEPCTMEIIKSYKPVCNSLGSGQVLHCAYTYDKAKIVLREMVEALALSLAQKKRMTRQITMSIGYDIECLIDPKIKEMYHGEVVCDAYGRNIPKHTQKTVNLPILTSSEKIMCDAVIRKYEECVNPQLLIRRINISANQLEEETFEVKNTNEQLDLFVDYQKKDEQQKHLMKTLKEEHAIMLTMNEIKSKYGKNKVLKASSLTEGATQKERNEQIGGHKA